VDDLVGALLHPHPRDPKLRGWAYFGCFSPDLYLSARATLKVTDQTVAMNATICINLCVADAMDFAIVRGNQCYCSNGLPDPDTGTDQCNTPCAGNAAEYCGGYQSGNNVAVTVYKRVISLIAYPRPAYPRDWTFDRCFNLATWLSLATTAYYKTSVVGGTDGIGCTNICNDSTPSYNLAFVSGDDCYCTTGSIAVTLWAGIEACSKPCTKISGESCGGTNKLGAALAISYVRRATPPTSAPPVSGTVGSMGWYNYGCYFGAVYLLDTILTGFQISSILDLTPDMNGVKCVTTCKARSYTFSMTIAGICFCNNKPPPYDLKVNLETL
jgi:hypothetical protein